MKRIAAAVIFLGLLILVFINAAELKGAALQASKDFALCVFPALMPSLILMMLYIGFDISPRSKRITPALFAALLGLFTGAPGSSRLLLSAYENSDKKAKAYCGFCATLSPMFILAYISQLVGSSRTGLLIFSVQLLTAICGGIFTSLSYKCVTNKPSYRYTRKPLEEILLSCTRAMLCVLSLMILFSVLIKLADIYLPLGGRMGAYIHAFLEIAGGAPKLAACGLSRRALAGVMGGAVSFGGVCVFIQASAFLSPLGVSLKKAAFLRLSQGVVGGALCYLLYPYI